MRRCSGACCERLSTRASCLAYDAFQLRRLRRVASATLNKQMPRNERDEASLSPMWQPQPLASGVEEPASVVLPPAFGWFGVETDEVPPLDVTPPALAFVVETPVALAPSVLEPVPPALRVGALPFPPDTPPVALVPPALLVSALPFPPDTPLIALVPPAFDVVRAAVVLLPPVLNAPLVLEWLPALEVLPRALVPPLPVLPPAPTWTPPAGVNCQ